MQWYGVLIISLIPIFSTVLAGIIDYRFWGKSIKADNPQKGDKPQGQQDKNNSEKFYKPNLIFYRFGTVLGIVVVTLYLLAYLLPLLLKESLCWQAVVLRLGILAGAITILAIIAKMIKED